MTVPVVVTIDAYGIKAVPFTEILAYFQNQFKTIYGSDIVIEPSTQDGQLIGVYSDSMNTVNNSTVAAFNSFRPSFAVGAGLSSIVKINGIARKIATASEVTVTLGGTAGTIIQNATITDNMNIGANWFIIGPVTIPPSGVINTLATCMTPGAVAAAPYTLTIIVSPIPGWQTVTNTQAAVVGSPIETDAQLRRRQTQSTAIPALTVLESMQGNLLNVPDVQRARVYQNDTTVYDANGIPPRSISAVVLGSDTDTICNTIARTKTPGVPTYGDIGQIVFDRYGMPAHINYFQLRQIPISALMTITVANGYSSVIGQHIQQSVANYVNNLQIGQDIFLGDVYSPANLDGDSAIEATGLTQASLDPLGQTYKIDAPTGLALSRDGMVTLAAAEQDTVVIETAEEVRLGSILWVTLYDGTIFRVTVIGSDGNRLTLAERLPQPVRVGTPYWIVGDVYIAFNEAGVMNPGNVYVQVH